MCCGQIPLIVAKISKLYGGRISRWGRYAPPYPIFKYEAHDTQYTIIIFSWVCVWYIVSSHTFLQISSKI